MQLIFYYLRSLNSYYMIHNINRRKFIELFGCGCGTLILPSCTTVPITERRQLSIYPEGSINNSAAKAFSFFVTFSIPV